MVKKKDLRIGIIIASVIILLSIISVFYLPYDINEMNTQERFLPPSFTHWFGTDNFGRDIFSRVIAGAKYTLSVAFASVFIGVTLGALLGLTAGYFGGIVSEIVMRVMDALNSFPGILLSLMMVALLKNGQFTVILALSILFVPFFTRIIRSGTLQQKSRDYVKIAQLQGVSSFRIILVHIFPNLIPSLFSAVVIGFSNAILSEASLSYLGLGIQPPLPSWGRMLSESQTFLLNAPWCALAPGIVIVLTIVSFQLIGGGLSHEASA
ncbi:ABC transporter permease [Scatolibacter rhodanostii]|uniref:ABC transporter permease n=1 Tax=Scatolibacter rhodanostii TaxID=2014781 RepID=UPI000C078118|nr:ABC transporter permease [Scatolibacter rhodanostii]